MAQSLLFEIKRGEYAQREAAEALGISQPHLSQILGGHTKPSLEVARRIATFTYQPLLNILVEYDILTAEEADGGILWPSGMRTKASALPKDARTVLGATIAGMVEVLDARNR